jgi:hypothetical protein
MNGDAAHRILLGPGSGILLISHPPVVKFVERHEAVPS